MTYAEYRALKYFPQLDGIRAVSVMMVVANHVPQDAFGAFAGFLGVTLFFVISGYLITTLALREEEERGRLNLGAFYIRRTFRILPLYYFALLFYAGFYGFVGNPDAGRQFFDRIAAYLLYYQEIPHARQMAAGSEGVPFDHSWSLGIEEKFYLVWPFLLVALPRRPRGWRLGAALLLCLGFGLTPLLKEVGETVAAYSLHPYHHILIGCCLALMLHDPVIFERMQFFGKLHFVIGVMVAIGMVQYAMPGSIALGFGAGWQSVYGVLGAMLIVVVFLRRGPLRWFLTRRFVIWIGTLSYGIYLFHFLPLLIADRIFKPRAAAPLIPPAIYPYVSWAFGVAGAIAIAWAMSWLVEKPMIRIGRRWAGRRMNRKPEPAGTLPVPAAR